MNINVKNKLKSKRENQFPNKKNSVHIIDNKTMKKDCYNNKNDDDVVVDDDAVVDDDRQLTFVQFYIHQAVV